MKVQVLRLCLLVVALAAMLYAGDWLRLRYQMWRHGEVFGSVTVTPEYVIHEKGGESGKTEYQFDPPQDQPCVHSLFPHFGYSPCWYLSRYPEKQIEI